MSSEESLSKGRRGRPAAALKPAKVNVVRGRGAGRKPKKKNYNESDEDEGEIHYDDQESNEEESPFDDEGIILLYNLHNICFKNILDESLDSKQMTPKRNKPLRELVDKDKNVNI